MKRERTADKQNTRRKNTIKKIPKRAKHTADIPKKDLNAWGYPDAKKWVFVGYTAIEETAWWVKA